MRNSSRKTVLKRVLAYALALALTLSVITVPSTDAYAASGSVKSVTVTNLPAKQVTIKKGKSFVLKTKVTTSGKISKAVVYKSSNSKVAKVTKTGKITAVKNGSTYVTVYAKANKKKVCKVKVTVGTPVSSVKLSKASATINKGKTLTLKATVSPKSASNKTLTWKSSNKKVATVSSKGVVKAVNAGTAKITATANDGSGKKYTCTVKVNIPVSSVKLNKASTELTEGEVVTLKATVAPSNASNKSVKWSTSNAKVATVSAGKVTAKSTGTATITAAAADGSGKKAVCKITVKAKPVINPEVKVSNITLSLADDTIYVGEKTKASVVVEPENATNKEVVYSVSDETVATIDAKTGAIEAKKEGTVKVTATAADGSGIFAEKTLTVEGAPTVEFTQKSVSLAVGKETLLGVKDSSLAVKYTSSNERVVSVLNSATGQIKAIAAGKATITVSLVDFPDVKDTCSVVVLNDDTVIITAFTGLSQEGRFTVKLSMLSDDNKITNDMLVGTKLYITNEETGKKITASYVTGSLTGDVATYGFNSSQLTSGTYVLDVPADSIFAINSGSVDSLKQTVKVTELKTGVAGNVYDDHKNAIEGATVKCLAGEKVVKTTTTDITGYYEMEVAENSGYTIEVSKDGYFDTATETGIIVRTNEVTTNEMVMESIDDRNLAMYGHVVLNSEDKNTLDKNELPKAALYVMVDDEWKFMESVTVSKDGYYAFMNSGNSIVGKDEYLVSDEAGNYMFKYYDNNYYSFGSYDTEKLSTDKMYKVVITKNLSVEKDDDDNYNIINDNAVYNSVELTNQSLSKTSKVTELKEVKLNGVAKFKGLTIPGGEISWGQEKCRPTGTKTTINCIIYSSEGVVVDVHNDDHVDQYHKTVNGINVNVVDSKQSKQDEDIEIIKADELTLPAGKYYAVISTAKCANVNIPFEVDATGSAVKLTNIEFNPSVDYGFSIRIDVDSAYYENEGLQVDDVITLKDLAGIAGTKNAYLEAELYEVSNGSEVIIKNYILDEFTVVNDRAGKAIEQILPISGLLNGKTYRIKFISPVLSLTGHGDDANEKYSDSYGYYEFKYEGAEVNDIIPKLSIQANIQNITLTSNAQFENFDATKPLLVNKVTLTDKDGKEVKSYTVNKYYSCGNTSSLSTDDVKKVNSKIYGGGDLIKNGIDVADIFANINPGNYTINISVNGYVKLSVPVKGLDLVGLSQGKYKVSDEYTFKLIEDTNINGTIKNTKNDVITDTVYITVLDSKGVVVATGASAADGTYKIVNGTDDKNPNVLATGETYTLVFRSKDYAVKTVAVKEALVAGGNKQDDVVLEKATGEIRASIYEEGTDKGLIAAAGTRVFVRDSKFVADSDKFVNDGVRDVYYALPEEGKGEYKMDCAYGNDTFWNVQGVEMDTYTIYVEGNTTYDSYTTKTTVTIGVHNDVQDMGKIYVPRATSIKTTPVTIGVIKANNRDLNAGGYDLVKIYAVDDNGSETYIDCARHNSESSYKFASFKLEKGKYRAYIYSRNYYRKAVDITVSSITEKGIDLDVALTPANN